MWWSLWAATTGGHDAPATIPEIPNLITLLSHHWHGHSVVGFLHHWENAVFAGVMIATITLFMRWATRHITMVPDRRQGFVEMLVQALDNMTVSIIGPEGRRFTPVVGTLFIYILVMNFAGMVPFLKSPTSSINTTIGLALCVFLYVQFTGVQQLGVKTYLLHFMGEPLWLAPIALPIHVIGELAKPLSLSLRLFGNITGEDALLGIMLILGAGLLGSLHSPVGLPLHVLFYPLIVLFSTIQALVFSMLSAVYISFMLPHEEHA